MTPVHSIPLPHSAFREQTIFAQRRGGAVKKTEPSSPLRASAPLREHDLGSKQGWTTGNPVTPTTDQNLYSFQ